MFTGICLSLGVQSSNTHPREALYSVTDLKARGWTSTGISKFLAIHDDDRPNPYRKSLKMKMYLRDRVHVVEKSSEFKMWKTGSEVRQDAAQIGVTTRTLNMTSRMEEAEITIKRGQTDAQIYELAQSTHGGNYEGKTRPFVWSNRTARNCIRHNLTNYEELWQITNRGQTGEPAYDTLRVRVDALVDEAYPQYADNSALPNKKEQGEPGSRQAT